MKKIISAVEDLLKQVDDIAEKYADCPEVIELAALKINFNEIKNILEKGDDACKRVLDLFFSDAHRSEVAIQKISLDDEIKNNIISKIDRCLNILKCGVDYKKRELWAYDLFKDYCYRFNRLKESIN